MKRAYDASRKGSENPALADERETENHSRRRVAAGAGVAMLLAACLGVFAWRMTQTAEQDCDRVVHSYEASSRLELALRHADDVETGVRGFALTGHEAFLQPYESGKRGLASDIEQLPSLVTQTPIQEKRLAVLSHLLSRQQALAADLVDARRRLGHPQSASSLLQGKQAMDGIRAAAESLEGEERRLLDAHVQRSLRDRRITALAIVMGVGLEMVFLYAASVLIQRGIVVAVRAQSEVRALNVALEQRVAYRTSALQAEVETRRSVEAKLRRGEERFRALLDGINDYAIYMLDTEGCVVSWNSGAARITGYSEQEIIGQHLALFSPATESNRQHVLDSLGKAALTGRSEEEAIRVRKDGSTFWSDAVITAVYDERGVLNGFSKVMRDTTDRRRADEELACSQEALKTQSLLLQSILNSLEEGVVAADEQGKFILWNPAATRIFGMGPANLPPEKWSEHYGAFLPDTLTPFPGEQNPLARALRGEVSSAVIYLRNPNLSSPVWIESNGAPLRDLYGFSHGGVITFRDITKRKADEWEIQELNEDLEEKIALRTAQLQTANQELQAFTYSVSHDLRSPLRHISGFSRILITDFGADMLPEARAHLQRIGEAVTRMGLLVDGLLSLARLGRQALTLKSNSLNAIVEQVVTMLQPECEGREVEWRIADLPALDSDRVLVGQVFQNLLSNALKYSRGRTTAIIEIGSIQRAGEATVIFVRDNGAGFNLQYAGKLFEVFQRMHTEAEFEGTGVGLATVYRIIQKHGGRIWAEAEVDRGATFHFTLGMPQQSRVVPWRVRAGQSQ
jgi:PAS domain S-box-containing protein